MKVYIVYTQPKLFVNQTAAELYRIQNPDCQIIEQVIDNDSIADSMYDFAGTLID